MQLVVNLIAVVLPVVLIAGLGYGWAWRGLPFDTAFIGRLVMNIGAPCLIISTLSQVDLSLSAFLSVAGYGALISVLTAAFGLLCLWLWRLPVRAFLTSVVFSNSGNMGLPVCLFAFGQEGLAFALAYFMLLALCHFTLGIFLFSDKPFWQEFFKNPLIHAVFIAVVMLVTDWQLPKWLFETIDLLGGFAIPLMLLTLGVSLYEMKLTNMVDATKVAVLRLIPGFLIAFAVTELLGLTGTQRGILILQSSMPIAVFNYIFAQRYDREPETVAGAVMLSTLASFIVLPIVVWVATTG